jgi:SAM-dependent methyltransferase
VSLAKLDEHRQVWASKPALRRIYRVWFDTLLATLRDTGTVLEVGAGPGFLSEHAREQAPRVRWVASDIVATPWNDLVADALRLPVATRSVSAVLGVDLVHHLAAPAAFFREAARVLHPGGHVAVVEPWVTPLSYPVYRWLHPEGCRLDLDPWSPFGPDAAGKEAFQGDGAVVWRLVKDASPGRWRELGFAPPRVELLNGFAYLLSLGFRKGSLLPRPLLRPLLALDATARPLARWLGLRALVVWRREA